MPECEKLKDCPFFNDRLADMPAMANMLKNRYCHKEKMKCARYMVAISLGKEKVPSDLFPNMHDRAKEILGRELGSHKE
ncbi:MAG: hypothetical protein JSV33_05935 [bacterium]|nr:MAG: hypothetical protein JSV33_05935 [bacterium]